MDFGQILDSKSYDQVCKYASMPVCQYARMQVYTCLYKKLNKKKERARPYPRLQDFFIRNSKTRIMVSFSKKKQDNFHGDNFLETRRPQ